MRARIKLIIHNWHYTEDGEEFDVYEVGVREVSHITEYRPQGEGDKWCYDVEFTDGRMTRVFNVNTVEFYKQQ